MIANKLNGLFRRKSKIDAILDAKDELISLGHTLSTKSVANLTGIKLRSVQLYYQIKDRIDFEAEIKAINDTFG